MIRPIPAVRQGRDSRLDPQHQAEFCSGAFSDELDRMGLRHQVIPGLRMNRPELRCFGRVRTIALETVETDDERIALGLGFLGDVKPGEFLMVKGSPDFAYFGELMTRLSLRGEVAGVAIDGLTRDSFFTQAVDLPIFARGYSPVDIKGRGRVRDVDVPIEVGGVSCRPGDFVFADCDAIVVIPAERSGEAFERVNQAAAHEAVLKGHIQNGMSIADILKRTTGF